MQFEQTFIQPFRPPFGHRPRHHLAYRWINIPALWCRRSTLAKYLAGDRRECEEGLTPAITDIVNTNYQLRVSKQLGRLALWATL